MSEAVNIPDALNFDGTERRANYRFIGFREDMLQALDKKDSAALIYEIIYRWQTEYKKPELLKKIADRQKAGLPPFTDKEIEEQMYVYMSYNDFVRESGGAVAYNTVIRTLDYLVNTKKALIQIENTDPRFADYMYSIDKDVTRKLLKELPQSPVIAPKIPKKKSKDSTQMGIPDNNSTHLGTPNNSSTQMGIPLYPNGYTNSTQMGTEVYPFGGTSHITTHTTNTDNITESNTATFSQPETSTSHDVTPSLLEEMKAMKALVASIQAENEVLKAQMAEHGDKEQASAVLPIASISTQSDDTQPTEQEQVDNGSSNSEQSVTSATEKPAGKGRGGNRKSRAKKNDIEVEPAPPPAAPDESMPWNVKKALAWADHFRGYDYPESNHTNSKYQRAVKACQTVIKRNISEKNFVYVFKYMKGVNSDFHSTFWADKDVDAWTVNDHFDEQVKEIRKRRPSATAEQQQPTKPKVMSIQEVAAMGRMKMAQTAYKPFNLAAGGQ